MKKNITQSSGGYIALIAVLIAGAVMLVAGLSASRSGIASAQGSTRGESSARARLLADACAEEALLRLRGNIGYTGNENVSVNLSDSCTIGSISGSGNNNRLVRTQASVLGYVSKIEVSVATVTPALFIASWRSVADF